MTDMKNILRFGAVAAVLLAGSCASPTNDAGVYADGTVNHPIVVQPSYQSIKLPFSVSNQGLMPEDSGKLSDFAFLIVAPVLGGALLPVVRRPRYAQCGRAGRRRASGAARRFVRIPRQLQGHAHGPSAADPVRNRARGQARSARLRSGEMKMQRETGGRSNSICRRL